MCVLKHFSHSLHLYSRLFRCCFSWIFKSVFVINPFPQYVHILDRTASWYLTCWSRFEELQNLLGHLKKKDQFKVLYDTIFNSFYLPFTTKWFNIQFSHTVIFNTMFHQFFTRIINIITLFTCKLHIFSFLPFLTFIWSTFWFIFKVSCVYVVWFIFGVGFTSIIICSFIFNTT